APATALPTPENGSRTISPLRVKKATKSRTRFSGNLAGCWIWERDRGGGLQTNQLLVNFIQARTSSSFNPPQAAPGREAVGPAPESDAAGGSSSGRNGVGSRGIDMAVVSRGNHQLWIRWKD